MTKVGFLVLALFAIAPVSGAAAQTPGVPGPPPSGSVRLGCFSPSQAFSDSADGKAAIARLTALQNEKNRQVEEKNRALQAQDDAYQQSAAVLSEEVRRERAQELERLRVSIQRFIQDAQAELSSAQREVEQGFVIKLKPAVDEVAKNKGLLIVFNSDDPSVSWFDPSLDITADVVKQLARLPGVK